MLKKKQKNLFPFDWRAIIIAPLLRSQAIFYYNVSVSAAFQKLVVKVWSLSAEYQDEVLGLNDWDLGRRRIDGGWTPPVWGLGFVQKNNYTLVFSARKRRTMYKIFSSLYSCFFYSGSWESAGPLPAVLRWRAGCLQHNIDDSIGLHCQTMMAIRAFSSFVSFKMAQKHEHKIS